MTNDKTREDFEAWVTKQGHAAGYGGDGVYDVWVVSRWWESWQAATQQSVARIEALEAIVKEKAPEAFATGAAGLTERSSVLTDKPILATSERDVANFAFQASQDMLDKIAALEAEVLALRKSLHSNKEWRKQMKTFIEAERGEG